MPERKNKENNSVPQPHEHNTKYSKQKILGNQSEKFASSFDL